MQPPYSFSRISSLPGMSIPLVEVRSDGRVSRSSTKLEDLMKELTWIDDKGMKQKTLPLRDLRIFLPSNGKSKMSFESPLHSLQTSPFGKEIGLPAIMPRPKAQCYLLDLGLLKLLCRRDRVNLLYDSSNGSSRRSFVNAFVEELKVSLVHNNRFANEHQHDPIAFELHVLEAALSCVVTKFHKQLSLVEPLLDGLINDAVSHPTEIKVGRLAALKKSLFAYNQGVQAIIQAIKELLTNDKDMADMYLGVVPREPDDHEEVEFLLEAYVADIQECFNEATGMIAQIEDSMEVISLHLNSQRNRIIKLSLIMEILAVTAGSGAVIGSIFGMNLLSGLENHPSAFFWITGATSVIMSSILVGLLLRFRHLITTKATSVEHHHSALKYFFSYVDDIETKVRLTESITRTEFEQIVRGTVGNDVDPKEIDLFFKVLDNNKNNCIEVSELPPLPSSRSKIRSVEGQPQIIPDTPPLTNYSAENNATHRGTRGTF